MKALITIALTAVLVACSVNDDSTEVKSSAAAPTIETASPDLALKSWWRVRDYENKLVSEHCQRSTRYRHEGPFRDAMQKIATGPALNEIAERPGLCGADVYERTIVEVKVESDTRAVALALIKQATPAPANTALTAEQIGERAQGVRYKYVLERVGKDWRVAEVYAVSRFTAGSDPWEAQTDTSVQPIVRTSVFGLQ